jgi:hypothetical protein
VAVDGKTTSLPCLNQPFIQTQHPEVGLPYGLVRTMTAALVSAEGRPCTDAIPIPATTNEVGHFQAAFAQLVETYGSLFDLVSYDAGGFSRANADAVIAAGKHYLFALKDEQRAMFRLADEMLGWRQGRGPAVSTRRPRLAAATWTRGCGTSPRAWRIRGSGYRDSSAPRVRR